MYEVEEDVYGSKLLGVVKKAYRNVIVGKLNGRFVALVSNTFELKPFSGNVVVIENEKKSIIEMDMDMRMGKGFSTTKSSTRVCTFINDECLSNYPVIVYDVKRVL